MAKKEISRIPLDDEGHEIARYDSDVPVLANDKLIILAEQAEKRIESVNKIKRIALKVTNKNDWTDQSGKPYLQSSGAEKVARLFGISWIIEEPEKEVYEDGHFSYTYWGKFSISGITIDAMGTRNSRDGFFKKYKYVKGEKIELPPSEIDPGDIKKSAVTNLIVNGITRLLGIRNLTWEDLSTAGISRDEVSSIDYKKDGKRQDRAISSEDSITEVITVVDIRKKQGEKNGKPWTQYLIKSGDQTFQTFNEKFALFAKTAKEFDRKIIITYKSDKFGNTIENIVDAKEQAPASSNEPTPEDLF